MRVNAAHIDLLAAVFKKSTFHKSQKKRGEGL